MTSSKEWKEPPAYGRKIRRGKDLQLVVPWRGCKTTMWNVGMRKAASMHLKGGLKFLRGEWI